MNRFSVRLAFWSLELGEYCIFLVSENERECGVLKF
jgi:hypothetical protein